MKKIEIVIGAKFGSLTVTKEVDRIKVGKEKRRAVEVLCDCGNTKIVRYSSLTTGNTTTCGCWGSNRGDVATKQKRLLSKIEDSSLSFVGEFDRLDFRDKILLVCGKCNQSFERELASVVYRDTGNHCPFCKSCFTRSEQHYLKGIKEALKDSRQRFVSKCSNKNLTSNCKVRLECVDCGETVDRRVSCILTKQNRCISCDHVHGFNPTIPAYLYLLELIGTDKQTIAFKYGITSNYQERVKGISRKFQGFVSVWFVWEYLEGSLARLHEKNIKEIFKPSVTKDIMGDGWTETFDKNLLNEFLVFQGRQYSGGDHGYLTEH